MQGQAIIQAAILANLDSVPAVVLQVSDQPQSVSDPQYAKDPISEAEALAILKESHALSDRELAERLGWSRKQVADLRRLLNLDPEVQEQVREGRLSAAKAAELVSIPPARQRSIAEHAVLLGWSLTDIRAQARKWKQPRLGREVSHEPVVQEGQGRAAANPGDCADQGSDFPDYSQDPDLRRLEQMMEDHLGCSVRIQSERGELRIRYGEGEVLEGLIQRLTPVEEEF